ncbi:three prime repair exonuclease 2 [Helicoverpa armigera]|uniref:three prime repair exonuclease 2 n=1 Tax=Helicoverpa armigera TaxID=29058 RepID=UPI003083C6E5
MAAKKIATYVFLDIQTTNYPETVHGEVRITELCMIAVKRAHVEGYENQPPIQNKIKMYFNPEKKVDTKISRMNGLTQAFLKHEAEFNKDVFNLMNSFINCLKKPVCLIAHNALKFHFPVLKFHFRRMNVEFPNDLMCTDSIYCLFDILEPEFYEGPREITEENYDDESEDSDSPEGIDRKNELADMERRTKKAKIGPSSYDRLKRPIFYTLGPRNSYKLHDIYERVIKYEKEDMEAEAICEKLMKIATAKSDEFASWVDRNHCKFNEVPEMIM